MTTQEKENSLTSPEDRDREKRWRPEQGENQLTQDEVTEAMKELNMDSVIKKFPRFDRTYNDPPIPMQNLALFSFTPAKGATPNKAGVFGFAKVRGAFNTPDEANEKAEQLIRTVDSYHKIFHLYVGRPFPLTTSSEYSADTSEVDMRKEVSSAVSNNIKDLKKNDEQVIKEIQEREDNLLQESRQDPGDVDPYDEYITLKVKKAQLSWTYLEHFKKIEEIRNILVNTRKQLDELDKIDPEFKIQYYDKYMKAREISGLDNKAEKDASFLRFMVEDAELPGIDSVTILDPKDILGEIPSPFTKVENKVENKVEYKVEDDMEEVD